MIRSTLQFDLACPGAESSGIAEYGWWKTWLAIVRRAIGPYVDEDYKNGDFVIDLDSPKLPGLVEVLEQLHKDGKTRGLGGGILRQRLLDDDALCVEWFEIEPKDWTLAIHLSLDGLSGIAADTVKPGVHFSEYYVSEQVKALAEKHKLTGVEFLWLGDVSRYRALQWFAPIVHRPLGRGLDHPWFDPRKVRRYHRGRPPDPLWRSGITAMFRNDYFKHGAGYGEPVKDRLLSMFPRGRLSVWSFRHVLRRFLPETDFAFTWRGPDEEFDGQDGRQLNHSRNLCVNRRTKDLLVANKLVSEDECRGVLVLNRAYRGAEVLDKRYPNLPGPLLSTDTLAHLREEEAAAWPDFVRHPKPLRSHSLAAALKVLRARKRSGRKNFTRPASVKAIKTAEEALPCIIPSAWQQVLRVTNGGTIEDCELAEGEECCIAAAEELVKLRKNAREFLEITGFDFADHLLPVVETAFGDVVCLNTAAQTKQGDCPVDLMSHETGTAERSWETVAAFLEELLASVE